LTSDARDRRRPYRLTADGRSEAQAWLSAQLGDDAPPRDDLVMKVLLAAHSEADDVHAVIDAHRHKLLAQLQEVRRRQREAPETLASRLCGDALTVRIEADLRWLDLCTERLAAHPPAANATPRSARTPSARRSRRRR
jgi:Virulence activator alpha C-term